MRSKDVPPALIYRPSKTVTQSGPRNRGWVLEFEPSQAKSTDPLMGWIASSDPFQPIRLRFPNRDSAVAFAEHNDWDYIVSDDAGTGERAHHEPQAPPARSVTTSATEAGEGNPAPGSTPEAFDPVLEADEESFPASDPPAWTGTTLSSRKPTQ
ncbi:hypothetical protein ATO11_04200 [Pseudaestuariivita atlantica]|uniref:ETC complex I subunit n=1 Tax=Pseudaestuariivita atlantica TaxID=1317121 RepID=A0A0L1JTM9_9RHOB|nr:hypothetical protein ATO11_04200 [Pseudaestuariivita atlantica]